MSDPVVILVVGGLAATACALVGTFLVLRRMSLLGDAISHAVLPGIVIAFLLTDSISSLPVAIGAGALGLFTVFLIETLRRTRRVKEDAAIAVVFPALFAIGVLLVAQYTGSKDLDQECVLYGEIALAPFDTTVIAGIDIVRPVLTLGVVAILNLLLVILFFKALKVATFDGALAATIGISPVLVHYGLMGAVSLTTVASFESVGAILVVAFLIVPPAAAHLLTDRLGGMLAISVLIAIGSSSGGYFLARWIGDASIAGCMALAMGAVFVLVWIFAPREGVFGRWLRHRRHRARFAQALLLERLGHSPSDARTLAADLVWPQPRVTEVLGVLLGNGLAELRGATLHRTRAGEAFVDAVVG